MPKIVLHESQEILTFLNFCSLCGQENAVLLMPPMFSDCLKKKPCYDCVNHEFKLLPLVFLSTICSPLRQQRKDYEFGHSRVWQTKMI